MCRCSPTTVNGYEYYPIIANMFRQCVYTPIEVVSFWLGMMNIGFWLVAQFPQVIENYIRGEVEALSPSFIIQWLLGDICNVIGCIFTKQYPTQLYTAIYYVIMDAIMFAQYAWYLYIKPIWFAKDTVKVSQKKALEQARREMKKVYYHEDIYGTMYSTVGFFILIISLFHMASANGMLGDSIRIGGRTLLTITSESEICDAAPDLSTAQHYIGIISAWISGILYFTARIPQIMLNHKRKSVEGLSFGMFFCAVMGNTCYGLAVLLPGIPDWKRFVIEVFPYILGSLCTLVTSFYILAQFFVYDYIPMLRNYMRW